MKKQNITTIILIGLFLIPLAYSFIPPSIKPTSSSKLTIYNSNITNFTQLLDSGFTSYTGLNNLCLIVNETLGKIQARSCASGSGDITAVNTVGVYLFGGATTGDANLELNETRLNQTINNLIDNDEYHYNQTTPAIDHYKSNPAGYYNITTLPASSGNASWNQSFANTLYQAIGSYLFVSDLPLTNRTISHWDNVTNKPANLDTDSTNDLLITDLPLHNRTLVNCLNITGADADFCNDATGGTAYKGDGIYLYNDSTTMYFNQTKENITINSLIDLDELHYNTSIPDQAYTDTRVGTANLHLHSLLNITGVDDNVCNAGDFVKNVTFNNGNLQIVCETPSGSGDITSVQGDIYITNGSNSGAVNLVFNETKNNATINNLIDNDEYHYNSSIPDQAYTDTRTGTANLHLHNLLNLTGVDDNACTGTDKVSNVTINNGVLSIVCTADQTGSGGGNPFDQVLNKSSNVTFASVNTSIIYTPNNITNFTIKDSLGNNIIYAEGDGGSDSDLKFMGGALAGVHFGAGGSLYLDGITLCDADNEKLETDANGFLSCGTFTNNADNSSWNESRANSLYAGIEWDYNQTIATFNQYGLWWYNQTIPAINDINDRFWNRTQSWNRTQLYNITEINNFNASWSSTYNDTYKNLLGQMCPVGQVVNGTLANGTFVCTTDQTGAGGGNPFNQVLNTSSNVSFGHVVPFTNNTYNLGNSTNYWNTTFQYRFCLGGVNCWTRIPFFYDDEITPNRFYSVYELNMNNKPLVVKNIEAEDSTGIFLNDTTTVPSGFNFTIKGGIFNISNVTGTSSSAFSDNGTCTIWKRGANEIRLCG